MLGLRIVPAIVMFIIFTTTDSDAIEQDFREQHLTTVPVNLIFDNCCRKYAFCRFTELLDRLILI